MKYVYMCIVVIGMGMTAVAEEVANVCYAYSTQGLVLSHAGNQMNREISSYRLLIAIPKKQDTLKYYAVLLQDPEQKVFAYQEVECIGYPDGKGVHCNVEGDGGFVDVDDMYTLYLESVLLTDVKGGDELEWWLEDSAFGTVRSPQVVACPSGIGNKVLVPKGLSKDYIQSKKDQTYTPERYVCYRKKEMQSGKKYRAVRYQGCVRLSEPCVTYGLKHFGKYPTVPEAGKALQRCRNATPRSTP